jgi:hypothetical protein
MYEIVKDFPDAIIFEEEGPFISLYQPTHRHSPGSKQDPIVFKNLIQRNRKFSKTKVQNERYKFYNETILRNKK